MALTTFLLLATAVLTNAHFSIDYPPMRANSLAKNTTYSQWINPCANVPGNLTGRPITPWPLSGSGSLKLNLHHPWTYVTVNLGLGADTANFNYTLTNPFLNETGNGTLCIQKLALPASLPVADGSFGTLQVVTFGEDGNALYNCADVVFSKNATVLADSDCVTSPGVSAAPIALGSGSTGTGTGTGSNSSSNSTAGKGSAGSAVGVNVVAMSSVVGLAVVFMFGMSL